MTDLRTRFEEEFGAGHFFLDPEAIADLDARLHALGWLDVDHVVSAERIGDGNMNLTVRIRTGRERTMILKQSRPWVEKYPHIGAPPARARVEASFYRAVMTQPPVSGRMPALLGVDEESAMLMLEDLGDAGDLMPLYTGARLADDDVAELTGYLDALHEVTVDPALEHVFRNREMRALNHAHQYDIPLRTGNGLDLDRITPGLAKAAEELQADGDYCAAIEQLGRMYLDDGATLVHGDYFPGSWLKNSRALYIIDPEFCFLGCKEYDLGVLYAHLLFTGHEGCVADVRSNYSGPADWEIAARFAGAELMRRLIGVAQLPLRAGLGQKREWLAVSRALVCG